MKSMCHAELTATEAKRALDLIQEFAKLLGNDDEEGRKIVLRGSFMVGLKISKQLEVMLEQLADISRQLVHISAAMSTPPRAK